METNNAVKSPPRLSPAPNPVHSLESLCVQKVEVGFARSLSRAGDRNPIFCTPFIPSIVDHETLQLGNSMLRILPIFHSHRPLCTQFSSCHRRDTLLSS